MIDEISFTSEVTGIYYFFSCTTRDWEGIVFLEANGTKQRIGRDDALNLSSLTTTDFIAIPSRFLGFSVKFHKQDDVACETNSVIELGIYVEDVEDIDCSDAVFLANPFTPMSLDTQGQTAQQTPSLTFLNS